MPRKAFLKKKSLLDRFKDDYATHTGYIQSARAKHTWNNPLTHRKRTKELNKWIKSFAGKDHIHKLARFNATNAGRYESMYDEAMSLKGFLENLTEKLTKQFDLDLEEVQAYLNSHTQEMQELLNDTELSLKEKVLFVRSEITGEQDEKKSEKLVVSNPCVVYKGDAENAAKAHDYLYKKMPRVKGASISSDVKPLGNNKFCRVLFYGNNTGVMDLFGYYSNLYNDDFWNNCDADPQGWVDPLTINRYDVATPRQESKDTDEKLGYEKGHKNSRGENAPWVIRSHEDNRILASFAHKKDAEEHLKRMKQYSKKEAKDEEMSFDDAEFKLEYLGDIAKDEWGMQSSLRYEDDHPVLTIKGDYNGDIVVTPNYDDGTFELYIPKNPTDTSRMDMLNAIDYLKTYLGKTTESKQSEAVSEYDSPIKDWYIKAFPTDDMGEGICGTFKGFLQTLIQGEDIYDYIDVGDSVIRERIFSKLAEMLDVDYDDIYYLWLNDGVASRTLKSKLNKMGLKPTREKPPTLKDRLDDLGIDPNNQPKIVKVVSNDPDESKKSEAHDLKNYTSDIISKLDGIWACGLNGAKRLAEKYADVIQQNYTDGDLSTAETAKFIAGQENLTESRKKTESKQSEVHLELIDTIIVPKWLWEAHTFGNEYGEDLDEHEQEILAKFEEEYGKQYYLDDRSEEADFRSRNDFDEYGGPCYEVDVYKMS